MRGSKSSVFPKALYHTLWFQSGHIHYQLRCRTPPRYPYLGGIAPSEQTPVSIYSYIQKLSIIHLAFLLRAHIHGSSSVAHVEKMLDESFALFAELHFA